MRLPNVFTAISDVLMGFVFARHSFTPGGALACLVAASALLYTAGMVLNDLFDLEIDRKERPKRPLPSGQISFGHARILGFGLLVLGVACGWLAGFLFRADADPAFVDPLQSGFIATLLAGAILLYDGFLKKTFLGPLGMGLCRLLNVFLGMSLAGASEYGGKDVYLFGYTFAQWAIACGLGIYIVGVTIYAKSEAEAKSQAVKLLLGVAVMIFGVCGLGYAAVYTQLQLQNVAYWSLLGLLALPIVFRAVTAAFDGSAPRVQGAVKHAILSVILLDAAVAAASGPLVYAIAIVLLLAPALLLGKWVYST